MGRDWRPWLMAAVMQHCFILVCFREVGHVGASHAVYKELQSVSATYVGNEPRTGYHFRPPKHWINDPNGPMYYKGFYHLFYQYNPKDAVWGNIVWAHSVSRDLINWESLDPAIYPSKVFDVNGCWSGSATILPGNKPVIMYTGIDTQNRQVQNVAFPKNLSDPYLREWIKPDYNPVIQPKAGINASSFRDPTTAWYGSNKHWMLAVGSKWDRRGKAILYRSKDFMHWVEAKHPLHSSENTGMWECPDFYPVPLEGENGLDSNLISNGVKHVLKVSLDEMRYEYYTIGTYDLSNDKYMPDGTSADDHTGLRYDYGNFYASKTFFDPVKGRRILWGWANESDTADNDKAKGWAGIQAIPRTVWLHGNGRQLLQWPIAELETLRRNEVSVKDKKLSSGEHFEVTGINTAQADVELAFDVSSLEKAEPFDPSWSTDAQKLCSQKGADVKGGVGPFGLFVLASADMSQRTAVFFRIFKAQDKHVVLMCHDPTRSTTRPEIYKPTFAGFVDSEVDKTGKISLRSLIDNSVVESFGEGGKTCITSRVYPTMDTGSEAHMFVFNNGATDLKVSELKAWQMGRPVINGA